MVMQTVRRRYTFTRQGHFIEGKSSQTRLTARVNSLPISFIIRAGGLTTFPMERAGKYTAPTHILRANLSMGKRKASVCTTGMQSSTIQDISLTILWTETAS
jgi:hypothetical protein